jgi:hypothetical protein
MNISIKDIIGYHENESGFLTLIATDGNGNQVNIRVYRQTMENAVREAKLVAESRKEKE